MSSTTRRRAADQTAEYWRPAPGRPIRDRVPAYLVIVALAIVLLLGFRAPGGAAGLSAPAQVANASPAAPAAAAAVAGSTSAPAAATSGTGTFTGAVVQDPYGPVQVQVTLASGRITEVKALQLPTQGRSGFISQSVEPILKGEAISAQSARIDTVSGATYTSQAYAQSLQSALDQARA